MSRLAFLVVVITMSLAGVSWASGAKSQNLKSIIVSVDREDAYLKVVLADLREASSFTFVYNERLGDRKGVTIKAERESLYNVLNKLAKEQQLSFTPNNSMIVVAPAAIRQRPGRVSGKVVDDRGQPLAGANIKVVGSGNAVQSGIDGTFQLPLPTGTYTLEVSYLGFQSRRVNGVAVEEGQLTRLNLALEAATSELGQVTVTGSFKKESVAGLYAQQKNAASVTDGISAEQIARTPDNDMGAALKRITGVTTINNRSVVVRGMGDRYNQAMLDGVPLASTSMNRRDFSFDIIPTEMVSSVVVNKTATPDVSSEFAGGQVSVNTLDIPDHNFTNIQIGAGINSQSIGKDFYRLGERHNNQYLGLYSKSAELPEGMLSWQYPGGNIEVPPPGNENTGEFELIPGNGIPYNSFDAAAQSRRLPVDPLKLYHYNGTPSQNYRLSLGRVYTLKNGMRFGFAASASLRNDQQVYEFNNVRGSNYGNAVHFIDSTKTGQNGAGISYRFGSNSGLVANLGLQGDKFKVSLKNMYARTYSDNYNESTRMQYEDLTIAPFKEQYQLPEAMSLQQHQISGEYALPWQIKATGMFTYNKITQRILDERKLKYSLTTEIGGKSFFQTPNVGVPGRSESALDLDSRMWTHVNEDDFNWALGFSRLFGQGKAVSTLVKLGYQGFDKRRDLSVFRMIPYASRNSRFERPYEEILDPANIGTQDNEAYYWAMYTNGPTFDGYIKSHAVYLMADQKLWDRLRLVYGVRGESFTLDNNQEALLRRRFPNPSDFIMFRMGVKENGWRWFPSINATYEVTPTFNVRSSYSRTAIRPDFRESSFFGFYDYDLDANIAGDRVESTIVDNIDVRFELYPGAGEIVSLTGYYKFLDRPIELVKDTDLQGPYYSFANMKSATNLGLELEVRKNLGFVGDQDWWEDFFVYANGTLLKSKVKVLSGWQATLIEEQDTTVFMQHPGLDQDRPLIGQSPWLVNLGLGYWGDSFGVTASYNQRGYRTNLTAINGSGVEYEKAPGQLDAQLYARLFRKKLEVKFNMANLINDWTIFYANTEAFNLPNDGGVSEKPVKGDLRYNKKDNDTILYRRKEGQRFSLSLTYSF